MANKKKNILKSFKELDPNLADEDDKTDVKGGKGKESRKLASFWIEQINAVDALQKGWIQRSASIIKRFRDDRSKADSDYRRRLNVLWSNVKTLIPALYGKPPIPIVERKFLQKDPTGRISSIILERNIRNEMENNGYHPAVKRAVKDYLLPGRGVCWVRYEPEIQSGLSIPITTEDGVEDDLADIYGGDEQETEKSEKLENTGEQLLSEQAPVDYINYQDFYMFPARARVWSEVQAVGKRIYISKLEAKERFSEEIAKALQTNNTSANEKNNVVPFSDTAFISDIENRSIEIFEIWNKTDRKIYWVSHGYEYLCDIKEDFLELKDFFPVPEPLSSTLTSDTMVPVPDYIEYQDQAIQIDEITQRLALLTKACKVAGTYDASNGALKRILSEGVENELFPVDSWAAHSEKGGVAGSISFLPLKEIQEVIRTLTEVRQNLMTDLDLITGISDVIRGTTDSRETLGGIRLKNNNAGTRLSDRQNEVAEFARNLLAIVGEIIAKHFSDKKLIEASGILYDDDMQPESILEELALEASDEPPRQAPQQPRLMPPQGMPGASMSGAPQMPMEPVGGALAPNTAFPGSMQGPGNVVPFPGGPLSPQMPGPSMMGGMPRPLMPQVPSSPNPVEIIAQRIQKAIDLLRKDIPRGYRIDIETDSTIFGDAQQEREQATMFITESTKFLMAAAQLGQQLPEAVPVLGRMLQWGIRKFRVGRDLESSFDTFVLSVDKKAKQASKNPQSNPEEQKAQAQLMAEQMKIKGIEAQNQGKQQEIQMQLQAQHMNDQRDHQKQQSEDQREMMIAQVEMANKQKELELEFAQKQALMNMEMQQKEREHQLKLDEMSRTHQFNQAAHQSKMEQLEKQSVEKDKMRKDKAKVKKEIK